MESFDSSFLRAPLVHFNEESRIGLLVRPKLSTTDIDSLFSGDLFKVGDARIDSEHDQLFDLIAQAKAKNFNDVSGLLEQLKSYTLSHFAHEEKFMEEGGYPLLEDHRGFHKDLIDKLSLISSSSLANNDQKQEILDLIQHWLKVHIFVHDQAYSQFFDEQRGN